ncbi:UxaA family hydrolase, partial [bacterium]|nr:UxaA family hydrolase [bacterium]
EVCAEIDETNIVVAVVERITFGHKFALRLIKTGEPVIKYGETIGLATKDILPGQHVHVHNLESCRGRGDK